MCTMHRSKKINIGDVNPHLLCVLCGGYFIDATTIIECLHSFCRTCLLRYLETSKTCPICEVLIHKTRPHQNIRSDKTLQDIAYKLVPGLYRNEMKRRREFYSQYPNKDGSKSPSEDRGDEMAERFIFTENEKISLALEYWMEGVPDGPEFKSVEKPEDGMKSEEKKTQKRDVRYLQCPGALTVAHLKKFIRLKFELPQRCRIDIYHKKEIVSDYYTLLDIACIFAWTRLEPLTLYYSIYENIIKKRKVEDTKPTATTETQTKMESTAKQRNEQQSNPSQKSESSNNDHMFLKPTATRDWAPQKALNSPNQQTKALPKASSPLVANPQVMKQSPESNPVLENTLKKQTIQLSVNGTQIKRVNPQPARIAPKILTHQQIVNQQYDITKASNQQPSKVIVREKSTNSQTVRMLVNNKTKVNQIVSVNPTPITQSITATQPNIQPHGSPKPHQVPYNQPLGKIKTVNVTNQNPSLVQSVKHAQSQMAKQPKPLTVTSVSDTSASQTVNKSKDIQTKQNGVDSLKPLKTYSKVNPHNFNGPLKVNMKDLNSIPEGAVIRSVKRPHNLMLNQNGSNSANNQKDKCVAKPSDNSVAKQQEKQLTKDRPTNISSSGDSTTVSPKVNGLPAAVSKLNNGSRPSTPKPSVSLRPSTPKMNPNSRPSTPKLNGGSAPSTPKVNGGSRPSTPKVSGGSRPSTPNLNGDVRTFKPIAPKPPLPPMSLEGQGVFSQTSNNEVRLPITYSKIQTEKRPIPTLDSSSSDICEEIRQRKLARMDEPLNLVKRDQPVSPVNGNVSPSLSQRSNLHMVVGSVGI